MRLAKDKMPEHLDPMLAVLAKMPQDEREYGFEYKWDGIRSLCFWDGHELRFESRNQIDITSRYPEFEAMQDSIGKNRLILDGEIITLNSKGCPDFGRLQQRMGQADRRIQLRLMEGIPAVYMIFDVLYWRDLYTTRLPYEKRRQILTRLKLNGRSWKISPFLKGKGDAMLETATKNGMEGIIAKRLESVYEVGRRSESWRKIKLVQSQELVIGGWQSGEGLIKNSLGSVLLGYYENGKLRYAGNVGTGFSLKERANLLRLLQKRKRTRNPFSEPVGLTAPFFCDPVYVVEIEFRGWTPQLKIRQGSFKGLRQDKRPEEIIREMPEE